MVVETVCRQTTHTVHTFLAPHSAEPRKKRPRTVWHCEHLVLKVLAPFAADIFTH